MFFLRLCPVVNCATLLLTTGCTQPPPFQPVATVRQLMDSTIHPSAEVIFESVGTIISISGMEEIAPKNDEEWANVRRSALTLAEAGNLLMIGDRPRDKDTWFRNARALTDVAMVAVRATEAKNPAQLFEAGGQVYEVCQRCHDHYWKGASREAGR